MRKLDHRNVVKLKYFFYSAGDKKEEVYLNLILEYVPETVYRGLFKYVVLLYREILEYFCWGLYFRKSTIFPNR